MTPNFNPAAERHLYNTLVMLAYMMDIMNPGHHWKERLGGRLTLETGQDVDLQLKEGRFCLKRSLIEQGGEGAARQAFEAFYSAKGEQRI